VKILAATVLFLITALSVGVFARTNSAPLAQNAAIPSTASNTHVFINTCLITSDVEKLAAFYAQVLQIKPHKSAKTMLSS